MPTTTPRSKGLRKFIPQPDRYRERYGCFTLTGRDIEILDTVYRYRYLEARHIRALVGGSGQQITRRLQGLFHHGYLGRYARRERMRLELDTGAPLIAYGLDLRGARALENRLGRLESVLWRKDYTRRTEWFLEHSLMVSNFRCILELALRESSNSELLSWKQGQETWFRVAIPGQRNEIGIAPDAHFVLRQNGQERHFLLEADRSTEEHRRLVRKFAAYWSYIQNLRRDGGHSRANVLFVTTGETRMSNMIETLRSTPKPSRANHGGKGMFWFCRADRYSLATPATILGDIWHRGAHGCRESILG